MKATTTVAAVETASGRTVVTSVVADSHPGFVVACQIWRGHMNLCASEWTGAPGGGETIGGACWMLEEHPGRDAFAREGVRVEVEPMLLLLLLLGCAW